MQTIPQASMYFFYSHFVTFLFRVLWKCFLDSSSCQQSVWKMIYFATAAIAPEKYDAFLAEELKYFK